MNICMFIENGIKRVKISGSIDRLSINTLKQAISDYAGFHTLILDLEEVDFACCDFIDMLMKIKHDDFEEFGKIMLCKVPEFIYEILIVVGCDKIYRIAPRLSTEEESSSEDFELSMPTPCGAL